MRNSGGSAHPPVLRRGLAAFASVLSIAALATPARADSYPPDSYRADAVTSIIDRTNDVVSDDSSPVPLTESRADVTGASTEYRTGEIAFTLNVVSASNPRTDLNWTDGASSAFWGLDTNSDSQPDYLVTLVQVEGLVVSGVVMPSDPETLLCLGSGSFDGTTYEAVIASRCVGNPASYRWGGGMMYDTNPVDDAAPVAIDVVPDGDTWAGPVAAPNALDAAAGGYWLVGDDGGIFSFNSPFHGSTGAIKLNKPIVGLAADPANKGYWFVASDGGIFAFGDAKFFGSTGSIPLSQPIVGMASSGTGNGYWFVASDGGIFSFGDAKFLGAAVGSSYPVVGMAAAKDGKGYSIVRTDGTVVNRGSAPLAGSLVGHNLSRPVVGIAATL